jgi:flagellar motor switch protein FliN/FliY
MEEPADDLDSVLDVPVEFRVELGRKSITLAELLATAPGHILMFDRLASDPVDVLVGDRPIGQGDVVAIDEEFAVRISKLEAGPRDTPEPAGDEPPRWGRSPS